MTDYTNFMTELLRKCFPNNSHSILIRGKNITIKEGAKHFLSITKEKCDRLESIIKKIDDFGFVCEVYHPTSSQADNKKYEILKEILELNKA